MRPSAVTLHGRLAGLPDGSSDWPPRRMAPDSLSDALAADLGTSNPNRPGSGVTVGYPRVEAGGQLK
jgi:hypothetical protein